MEIGQITSFGKLLVTGLRAVANKLGIHISMSAPCSMEGTVGRPIKTQDGKMLYPVFIDLSDASRRITIQDVKASGELYQAIGDGTAPNSFRLGRSYGSKQIECGETLSPGDYGKWFRFFIDGTNSNTVRVIFGFGWFSSMTYTGQIPYEPKKNTF